MDTPRKVFSTAVVMTLWLAAFFYLDQDPFADKRPFLFYYGLFAAVAVAVYGPIAYWKWRKGKRDGPPAASDQTP